MNKLSYLKGNHPDGRVIFFALSAGQLYGQGSEPVVIHWEVRGEVFLGEMPLDMLVGVNAVIPSLNWD